MNQATETGQSREQTIWAEHALTANGWQQAVTVSADAMGMITSVRSGTEPADQRAGVLLPAPANLHSHAFQRAMAGLTETRGPNPEDSFWTWRTLMYNFLDQLTPDDVEAITAFVQMEMLESGYASVGEFHYLHHQPDGSHYSNPAEMSERVMAAAATTGIGLTLLPVLYQHGGCDGRPLVKGQCRFAHSMDEFARLYNDIDNSLNQLPADASKGVAPHSLRAVTQDALRAVVDLAGEQPKHIHVAEQTAEVDEINAAWGARPIEWLLQNYKVDNSWCIIHATQMQPQETLSLAASGATVGLCPITESSLGDGIFDGMRYSEAGGHWGVGSDSNIRISLAEELRTLEYSQRLRDRKRAMFANPEQSTGRVLFEQAVAGGARALQRNCGVIDTGYLADLVALDKGALSLAHSDGDGLLDGWIFAGDDSLVSDVWAAGRHLVSEGRHSRHDSIEQSFRRTMQKLSW